MPKTITLTYGCGHSVEVVGKRGLFRHMKENGLTTVYRDANGDETKRTVSRPCSKCPRPTAYLNYPPTWFLDQRPSVEGHDCPWVEYMNAHQNELIARLAALAVGETVEADKRFELTSGGKVNYRCGRLWQQYSIAWSGGCYRITRLADIVHSGPPV
jgi:hypothetical protein